MLLNALLNHVYATLITQRIVTHSPQNQQKLQLLLELLEKEQLEWPTQALLQDWLTLDLETLHHLCFHAKPTQATPQNRRFAPFTLESGCHASAALNVILDPSLSLYTGLSDRTHHHSWLVDTDAQLLEPTPVERDHYFGYRIQEPVEFAVEQFESIAARARQGEIPAEVFARFQQSLDRQCQHLQIQR